MNGDLPTRLSEDDEPYDTDQLVLADLVNRVLDKGVVISGQATISVAGIDLLMLDLRLLLTSIQSALEHGALRGDGNPPVLPPDAPRG